VPGPETIDRDSDATRVFVSYCHTDRKWLERLRVHITPLIRDGVVDIWDDTRLPPGEDWEHAIVKALSHAQAAIVLVSADFLASEFITNVELPRLLLNARERGTVILPLIIGHSQFSRSELARFQAVNDPDRPLGTVGSRARADRDLAAAVSKLADLLDRAAVESARDASGVDVVDHARESVRTGWSDEADALLDDRLSQGTDPDNIRWRLAIERARSMCYSGREIEADRLLGEVASEIDPDDTDLVLAHAHAAYIVAHCLERNDQAASWAQACIRLADREARLMSEINLGDALWGGGRDVDAAVVLRRVHEETLSTDSEHVRALAMMCHANVIAQHEPAAARALYEEGIRLAVEGGWRYDQLYGQIYRALLDAEERAADGSELYELGDAAAGNSLGHLAQVAVGFGAMRDAECGVTPRRLAYLSDPEAVTPMARAYVMAAVLRTSPSAPDARRAAAVLFELLSSIEGLKGRPRFVLDVADAVAMNEHERTLAQKLRSRFVA
jgi:hypothetical protein